MGGSIGDQRAEGRGQLCWDAGPQFENLGNANCSRMTRPALSTWDFVIADRCAIMSPVYRRYSRWLRVSARAPRLPVVAVRWWRVRTG